ncbi:hypothetical protein [Actinocrispum sp. NPDC049592]
MRSIVHGTRQAAGRPVTWDLGPEHARLVRRVMPRRPPVRVLSSRA